MRLIYPFTLGATTLALVLFGAAPARADWLLTPFAGATFGADSEKQNLTYGGSLAYMGASVVG